MEDLPTWQLGVVAEDWRTACQNNLKQIALAGLNFESAHARLPGAYLGAHPNVTPDTAFRGVFVELMPYLDAVGPYQSLDRTRPVFAEGNRDLLAARPAVLKCPSAGSAAVLTGLAERIDGLGVPGLDAEACDYAGNGGEAWQSVDNSFHVRDGSVDFHIERVATRRRMADILDGSSNTLFFWDSAGDRRYHRGMDPTALDESISASMLIPIGDGSVPGPAGRVEATTRAAVKAYMDSWAGILQGGVYGYDAAGVVRDRSEGYTHLKTINASNQLHSPYSLHPGGANAALVDGSVRFLSEFIDQDVALDMASANGGV